LTEEMIKRINQLAKKKREEGLTPEELQEQKELYAIYLRGIREQVKMQLDARVNPSHPAGCNCCTDHHHHDGKCQH
jgi:uncharacterized protein YnzC (UPF0291/DUF896 family)